MTTLTKDIKAVTATDDDDDEPISRDRTRDENQQSIDNDAKELHDAWAAIPEADRPSYATLASKPGFKKAKKIVYVVAKADRSAVKSMIRRACLLHKGVPVYVPDKPVVAAEKDGDYRIKWTWAPPIPKAKTTENAPATEATPATDPSTIDIEATHEAVAGQTGDPKPGGTGRRWRP